MGWRVVPGRLGSSAGKLPFLTLLLSAFAARQPNPGTHHLRQDPSHRAWEGCGRSAVSTTFVQQGASANAAKIIHILPVWSVPSIRLCAVFPISNQLGMGKNNCPGLLQSHCGAGSHLTGPACWRPTTEPQLNVPVPFSGFHPPPTYFTLTAHTAFPHTWALTHPPMSEVRTVHHPVQGIDRLPLHPPLGPSHTGLHQSTPPGRVAVEVPNQPSTDRGQRGAGGWE